MKDIEKLLRMTESPQDYSDEELQQLLSDPEMQDYYELMIKAEAGFAERKQRKNRGIRFTMLLKIAAMFVGVLLLSGIVYAAYHDAISGNPEPKSQEMVISRTADIHQHEQTDPNNIRTFENAELQQILQELSDYYHVGVEYRNEQARHIRLYTKWDTTASLSQTIERLNGFEKVSIYFNNNLIIAE